MKSGKHYRKWGCCRVGLRACYPNPMGLRTRAPGLESRGSVWGYGAGFEPLIGNTRQSSYGAGAFFPTRLWRAGPGHKGLTFWATDPRTSSFELLFWLLACYLNACRFAQLPLASGRRYSVTLSTRSFASASVEASATILKTGSVFDPRASSQRSGHRTLTPSVRSIS